MSRFVTEQWNGQIASQASTRASIVTNDLFPYRLLHCREILLLSSPPSNYDLITMQDQVVSIMNSNACHCNVQICLVVLINTKTIYCSCREKSRDSNHIALARPLTVLSLQYLPFTQIVIVTTT